MRKPGATPLVAERESIQAPKGRNNGVKTISPLRGLESHFNSSPGALPLAFTFRPFGAFTDFSNCFLRLFARRRLMVAHGVVSRPVEIDRESERDDAQPDERLLRRRHQRVEDEPTGGE